jgi:hypothetical protein
MKKAPEGAFVFCLPGRAMYRRAAPCRAIPCLPRHVIPSLDLPCPAAPFHALPALPNAAPTRRSSPCLQVHASQRNDSPRLTCHRHACNAAPRHARLCHAAPRLPCQLLRRSRFVESLPKSNDRLKQLIHFVLRIKHSRNLARPAKHVCHAGELRRQGFARQIGVGAQPGYRYIALLSVSG